MVRCNKSRFWQNAGKEEEGTKGRQRFWLSIPSFVFRAKNLQPICIAAGVVPRVTTVFMHDISNRRAGVRRYRHNFIRPN